ncbi:Sjogren's syndrome/scleroderma autoantigen 1 family protein [Natronorubrum sp. DTA7]|uniref:Sjogren's syndrome/scleroderma autoantigen 1 family protein n=1 Tax=Natronorubrum sp. DTA7 TaxID=3447016 RepID=UPI003F84AF52
MSDFDKEAEREKLREKYERDEREREATQRMSDLLLKGATMTNAHCGTCGDPLFQEDGTTFCPSCHGNPDAVQGTELEAQPAEETADKETADTEAQQTDPAPSSPADAEVGGTATDTGSAVDPAAARGHDPTDSGVRDDSSGPTDSVPETDSSTEDEPRPGTPSSAPSPRSFDGRRSTTQSSPADGDLEAAHASLVQTLEKFARKAAETDDPRYAKECLEAAREASETLETLR